MLGIVVLYLTACIAEKGSIIKLLRSFRLVDKANTAGTISAGSLVLVMSMIIPNPQFHTKNPRPNRWCMKNIPHQVHDPLPKRPPTIVVVAPATQFMTVK